MSGSLTRPRLDQTLGYPTLHRSVPMSLARLLALVAVAGSLACSAGTTDGGPTEPEGPLPPPSIPAEVSAIVQGNVTSALPGGLWYWATTVRAFAPDCSSPLGYTVGADVVAYNDKGGAAYRAVLRQTQTRAGDGCVEVTLTYQREYSNPAPPRSSLTITLPVRFTENGDGPLAPIYRAEIVAP